MNISGPAVALIGRCAMFGGSSQYVDVVEGRLLFAVFS
jgi:hypothetical protein